MSQGRWGATRASAVVAYVAVAVTIAVIVGGLSAGAETAPLLEGDECDAPVVIAPPSPAAPVLAGGGAAVPIQMEIPPTVFVRLDASGAVDEVMTNTGCAPRRTDRFLVERDGRGDGIVPAHLVEAILDGPATGDWRTPGGWHPA